ncbi:hypothetical protein [Oceanobacillus sojae]|uniref:Lipoprotein n=1 Tax=Oceanobacillus sojae TaxID=582851 RepID=A0A511ZKB9_9BACI|nr:hypothetical protein [Oceanobacillus sojae]GEN87875.1 hypothetical protein OSO01_26140 [Oceanobacillus sojae]
MKKGLIIFIAFLSVFFISACSNDSNSLSGKTFKVANTPVFQEDIDKLDKYPVVVTLEFLDDNAVRTIDTEGTYQLNDDELVINFENENENLEITFSEFKESEKDFSTYSTIISNRELQVEDHSKLSRLEVLANKLSEDMPIEFIEKQER